MYAIRSYYEKGYIVSIEGGEEASALLETVTLAEKNAWEYEKTGKIPEGMGAEYAKNARNIGELGIGLNPKASVSGNMLEDEKAFRTCHFAVGHNYDDRITSYNVCYTKLLRGTRGTRIANARAQDFMDRSGLRKAIPTLSERSHRI